jgi:hypothetical protein
LGIPFVGTPPSIFLSPFFVCFGRKVRLCGAFQDGSDQPVQFILRKFGSSSFEELENFTTTII